jgi:hypothetical protein
MASDNMAAAIAGGLGSVQDLLAKYIENKFKVQSQDYLSNQNFQRENYINPQDFPESVRTEYGINQPVRKEVLSTLTPRYLYDQTSNSVIPVPRGTIPLPKVNNQNDLGTFEAKEKIKAKYAINKEEEKSAIKQDANIAKMKPKAMISTNKALLDLDRMESEAKAILSSPDLGSATGVRSTFLPKIPGTKARDISARINTLKSQSAFSSLQEMRNSSPTGGALGQVSDRENQLLQDNLTALDQGQSKEGFKKSLERLIKYTQGAKERIRQGYTDTFNEDLSSGSSQNLPIVQQDQPAGIPQVGSMYEGKKIMNVRKVK